ncbi:sulfide:quinone oxidoreductase [Kribbella sp. VKM Ac-2571]|uniref:type III sulfide quinone reductase, selenoprotein subtype n=1 Tax=Kribbella sp. VKM Ac-2571 TaxID=2512222 RepID=UPI00105E6304|nr:FAD/NAD(P)-binding oxidoreductase [Kribbella sp. VKM Ac-2571]TDO58730.1 sulfide:quinone oxidoreductase [Kribbella sp. VKM Ac-2571]
MKRLVILGGGTAGTVVANKLRRGLARDDWRITVIDRDRDHLYQPGLLFVPFGGREDLLKPRRRLLRDGIQLLIGEVAAVDTERKSVKLFDGDVICYDYLVIATGTSPRPDQTPGMLGAEWRRSIHDFYTYDGAFALRDALQGFTGGRLVVHVVEQPIKCPVAPLEFTFLAEAFFRGREMRDQVELVYVTPLDGAFTKPIASRYLGRLLDERKIKVETDFLVERVDAERKTLVSYDEREIGYDLLVTVPLNMGADFIGASGLGDELNYVPVDKQTLQSRAHPEIFAIGDANDIPTSKAGSVAHFSSEIFVENFFQYAEGLAMTHRFDGHANCFVETGDGRGLLIDFNYDTEPLPGRFPFGRLGPLSLLRETKANHWGKLAFRWIYWNLLVKGRWLPIPSRMSMNGKHRPDEEVRP